MPYPWATPARYDGAEYKLDHLSHFEREVTLLDRSTQRVQFRFHYHCFTDAHIKGGTGHTRFVDPDQPEENRVFCPQRWFLSQQLRKLLDGEIDGARVSVAAAYQWVWRKRIEGISIPYAIYLKIAPGMPGGSMVVHVNSAHTRPDLQRGVQEDRFIAVLERTKRTGQVQGVPPT